MGPHRSGPLVISGDGAGGDLGYPSTVELAGGRLLTVWYEEPGSSQRAVLRQAVWSIAGKAGKDRILMFPLVPPIVWSMMTSGKRAAGFSAAAPPCAGSGYEPI
jgi:hypothetical protein